MHLGTRCLDDSTGLERRVVAFLDSIKDDAEEIYFVGDVLDYWFEYKHVVPRGFVRFFGKVAELSDSGVKITWLTGNHDTWIDDYLPKELGVEVVEGALIKEIAGKRFFLEHGDGVGEMPAKLRLMRKVFHSKICRKLFSGIHPRWTVPLANGWSNSNRKKHRYSPQYYGPDKEPLILFAKQFLTAHDIDYFVFGHRHILVEESIEVEVDRQSRRAEVVILGEWMDLCSYAVYDGEKLQLRRFEEF